MEEKLKEDLLQVMRTVEKFFREDNVSGIKNWSDHIIHSATIYQDKYSLKTAIMVYALSSILEDGRFREKFPSDFNEFRERVLLDLEKAISYLEKRDDAGFEAVTIDILRAITKADIRFSEHLGVILRKAKIVKGSWLHHHGISLGRVARLLGITKWELMRKVGGMDEEEKDREINRLEIARGFFNG